MKMLKQGIAAAHFVLLVAFYSHLAAASFISRNRNGVRLILESGSRGRIEISTRDPTLPGVTGSQPIWLPVCASSFDDTDALYMCKLLGYRFGRSFSSSKVAFTPSPAYKNSAGRLSCSESPSVSGHRHHRRLLHGAGEAVDAGVVVAASEDISEDGQQQQHVTHRELAYRAYSMNIPGKVNISCRFYYGECEPAAGPFAGIECSTSPLPPAPPPPPSPPSPPLYHEFIRVVGGTWQPPEANLCPSEDFCRQFGRVEIQVPTDGGPIWAPLCAVADETLRDRVADIACQQAYGWPRLMRMPPVIVFDRTPVVEPYNFTVPTGSVDASAGDFDPSAYQGWATMTSVIRTDPTMLHIGNYTISDTPCKELFAVRCEVLYAGRT